MKALITDKAYNWAAHAKYDEKAVFQDLTNDLKRYQAAKHPEDLPLTNTEKQVFQSDDAPKASQSTLPATPGGTLYPGGVKGAQTMGSVSGVTSHSALHDDKMTETVGGLPSLNRSHSDTRPVNHSACPTLWGYSRQQAISKTTAPSMANAKANSRRLKSQIINDAPVGAPPTCVDCNTFLAGTLDQKSGSRGGKATRGSSEPSSFALKRGYIYVPPKCRDQRLPSRSMLKQCFRRQAIFQLQTHRPRPCGGSSGMCRATNMITHSTGRQQMESGHLSPHIGLKLTPEQDLLSHMATKSEKCQKEQNLVL